MATKYKYNEARREWSTLVYDGTLTPTGEKHRKRITSKKSSKDLENKVIEFKRQIEEESANIQTNITVEEYSLKWLNLYKSNREKNTQIMYKNTIKLLEPIYYKRLSDITRSDFQYVINLNKEKPRSCILIKQTFNQILKSAVLDGIITDLSYRKITTDIILPKYVKSAKQPLTAEERNALLNCELDASKRAFVTLLYYCGLRKAEALALETTDFDFKKDIVKINKVIIYPSNQAEIKPYTKSHHGMREIPLNSACKSILIDYVANCTGKLFKAENGAYLSGSAYKSMWSSIVLSCNKYLGYNPNAKKDKTPPPITGLTAHRLRHNYCTLLCYQIPKISTKTIARLLGDSEQMVLNVYSHIMEEKENVTEAVESAFL